MVPIDRQNEPLANYAALGYPICPELYESEADHDL